MKKSRGGANMNAGGVSDTMELPPNDIWKRIPEEVKVGSPPFHVPMGL